MKKTVPGDLGTQKWGSGVPTSFSHPGQKGLASREAVLDSVGQEAQRRLGGCGPVEEARPWALPSRTLHTPSTLSSPPAWHHTGATPSPGQETLVEPASCKRTAVGSGRRHQALAEEPLRTEASLPRVGPLWPEQPAHPHCSPAAGSPPAAGSAHKDCS